MAQAEVGLYVPHETLIPRCCALPEKQLTDWRRGLLHRRCVSLAHPGPLLWLRAAPLLNEKAQGLTWASLKTIMEVNACGLLLLFEMPFAFSAYSFDFLDQPVDQHIQ